MSDEILFERKGGLGIVTLNRPQALNTLSLAMYRRFDPALAAWAEDPRCGRSWCAAPASARSAPAATWWRSTRRGAGARRPRLRRISSARNTSSSAASIASPSPISR